MDKRLEHNSANKNQTLSYQPLIDFRFPEISFCQEQLE